MTSDVATMRRARLSSAARAARVRRERATAPRPASPSGRTGRSPAAAPARAAPPSAAAAGTAQAPACSRNRRGAGAPPGPCRGRASPCRRAGRCAGRTGPPRRPRATLEGGAACTQRTRAISGQRTAPPPPPRQEDLPLVAPSATVGSVARPDAMAGAGDESVGGAVSTRGARRRDGSHAEPLAGLGTCGGIGAQCVRAPAAAPGVYTFWTA